MIPFKEKFPKLLEEEKNPISNVVESARRFQCVFKLFRYYFFFDFSQGKIYPFL